MEQICECGFIMDAHFTSKLSWECSFCKMTKDVNDVILFSSNDTNINDFDKTYAHISLAAHDRVNKTVHKKCSECENDVMAIIIYGDLNIAYNCKCGNIME